MQNDEEFSCRSGLAREQCSCRCQSISRASPLLHLGSGSAGLGLDVAQDRATQAALLRATHPLLNTRVKALRGRRLKWLGLRCRIECKEAGEGYQADLRAKANDASTSFCAGMKRIKDRKASLAVLDDEQEGAAAMVVISDTHGWLLPNKIR